MSVFTPLARPELETFLAPYGLGRLLDFQGIAAGSENTNFFISLEQGEFVLTLVERAAPDESLQATLARLRFPLGLHAQGKEAWGLIASSVAVAPL